MRQPPGLVPPKTAFHTIKTIREAKYLRNTHGQAHFHQNGRYKAYSVTGNGPPMGMNDCFKEKSLNGRFQIIYNYNLP